MSSPHQDSLLPRFAQGEEGHETTTKFPCLVCVDRVSHTVDIHLSDTKIAVRDSLQRRTQGGGGFHGLRKRGSLRMCTLIRLPLAGSTGKN